MANRNICLSAIAFAAKQPDRWIPLQFDEQMIKQNGKNWLEKLPNSRNIYVYEINQLL